MEKKILHTPPSIELEEKVFYWFISYSIEWNEKEKYLKIVGFLETEAHLAKHRAYCPYSQFRVGAALLTASGKIYSGCNIENAAYPLATCAERTALVKAVSKVKNPFRQLLSHQIGFTGPCGSCRQILAEFGLDLDVYLINPQNESKLYKLRELLPIAFTPHDLQKPRTNHDIIE